MLDEKIKKKKKVSEEDTNGDGFNDLLNLNIFISGIPANEIKAAKLLLLFNCSLTVIFLNSWT